MGCPLLRENERSDGLNAAHLVSMIILLKPEATLMLPSFGSDTAAQVCEDAARYVHVGYSGHS